MRLLLDTHALVWWISDVSRLTRNAYAAIADPRNDIFCQCHNGLGNYG